MADILLNGTEYGLTGLVFEIKRGATWKETFFFEGNLTDGAFKGYLCKKKEGELLVEFSFSPPEYGNFLDPEGNPLEGFTCVDAFLSAINTSNLPPTPEKQPSSPRAGRDFWEADIEFEKNNGAIVISLLSAIAYVRGQCQGEL